MFQVTLTKRDTDHAIVVDGALNYRGTSLILIVEDVDKDVLCRQLEEMIAPGVDIWITPTHLMYTHQFEASGESLQVRKA